MSAEACCLMVTLPLPPSPDTENVTPSLVALMAQVSPMVDRSRMMRWNSPEDMRTVAMYSVSGMPRCSLSMSISFMLNSEMRSDAAGRQENPHQHQV